MTVGKIYGGLLILENWKATKFGRTMTGDLMVSRFIMIVSHRFTITQSLLDKTTTLVFSEVLYLFADQSFFILRYKNYLAVIRSLKFTFYNLKRVWRKSEKLFYDHYI